jgi:hypothetical protein
MPHPRSTPRSGLLLRAGWATLTLAIAACDGSSEHRRDNDQDRESSSTLGASTPEIEIIHIGTPDGKMNEELHVDRGLEGTWTGQYKCGQGAMLLEVGIHRQQSGKLMASIQFDPSEHATDKARGGIWRARVIFTESSRTTTLEPDQWEDQPDPSYQMLLFKGRLDRPEMHLIGDVLGEQSCSKFTLTRKGPHPYTGQVLEETAELEEVPTGGIHGQWEGSYNCGGNKMGLKLNIRAEAEDSLLADVLFHPADGDASIMKGGHWVAKVEENGPGANVQFLPRSWVTQPDEEYEMLEISGRLNESSDKISGDIINQDGCSSVILRRPVHKR